MELLLWPDGAPNSKGQTLEDKPMIKAYLCKGGDKPAVIVCPGGGYGRRAAHEGEPIAKWLTSLGISAFVLRYRVAPYQYPCALLDLQRAIRMVRFQAMELGINSNKVAALGFSAGGHLVSTAGTAFDRGNPSAEDLVDRYSCRPDLLVLSYPVITMKEPYLHEGSRRNLLGENPNRFLIDQLSNETKVTKETPPTFLWHTSDDESVPVENSLHFAEALRKQGVLFDLHVYSKGRHGLGMAESDAHVRSWQDACVSWFRFHQYI